jgi:hypothetical protein
MLLIDAGRRKDRTIFQRLGCSTRKTSIEELAGDVDAFDRVIQ